ncbi:MAG: MinD/ParA family protein [Deltaproteobacteria bacterium]|nr:MinD/ParA family protein [Deltaproteobacteria bacterium]
MARIITVTSGKGGVGKTNISVNMSLYLASLGYSTCLFDADMGLANIDILLGYYPEYTLEDVLSGKKSMKDIIIKGPSGLDIIPGSSGVKLLADPEQGNIEYLVKSLSELGEYDYFIFDTSAGISKNVISFCLTSPEIVLVMTPEPTSITDAYALLKILCLNRIDSTVMVAINQCMSMEVAYKLFAKFREVVQKNLKMDIFPLGTIPLDPHVPKAVKEQEPLITRYPLSDAAKGVKNLARYLISKGSTELNNFELKDFWQKCIERLGSDLVLAGTKVQKPQTSTPVELSIEQKKRLREGEQASAVKEAKEHKPPEKAPEKAPEKPADKVTEIVPDIVIEKPSVTSDHLDTGSVLTILDKLVKGISSVSSELAAIRRLMEDDRKRAAGR